MRERPTIDRRWTAAAALATAFATIAANAIGSATIDTASSSPTALADARWRSLGPEGALPRAVALGPDGRTAWLATTTAPYDGSPIDVYVSPDGGRSWTRAASPGRLEELAPDPTDANAAWALVDGITLWRTVNRGTSWELVYDHSAALVDLRDLHVAADGTVYLRTGGMTQTRLDPATGSLVELRREAWVTALGPDDSVWINGPAGIERSRDRGATWSHAGPPIGGHVAWLAVDPTNPERLYAWRPIASYGAPLLRSDDGGASFTSVGVRLRLLQRPTFGTDAILHSRTLGARGWREIRSTDHGSSWQPTAGLPVGPLGYLASAPREPRRLLYVPGGADQLATLVSGDGGDRWHRGGRGLDAIELLALVPPRSPHDRVFALLGGGVSPFWTNSNVLHRRDTDGRWQPAPFHRQRSLAYAVTAATDRPGWLWVSTHRGIFVTRDGGDHWRRLPLAPGQPVPSSLVAHPRASRQLFSASLGNFYPCGKLGHSTDSGATWRDTDLRLDVLARVTADPGRPQHLGLTGVRCSCSRSCDGDEVLAISRDGGGSWVQSELPVPAVGEETTIALVFSPHATGVALLATPSGLFRRATDAGPWERLDRRPYLDLVAGRRHLYAVVRLPGGEGTRVLRSADDGTRWEPVALREAHQPIRLEVVPGSPDRVYGIGRGALELVR